MVGKVQVVTNPCTTGRAPSGGDGADTRVNRAESLVRRGKVAAVKDVEDLEEGRSGRPAHDEAPLGAGVEVVGSVVSVDVSVLGDKTPVWVGETETTPALDVPHVVLCIEQVDEGEGEAGGPLRRPSDPPVAGQVGDRVELQDVPLVVVQEARFEFGQGRIVPVVGEKALRVPATGGIAVARLHLPLPVQPPDELYFESTVALFVEVPEAEDPIEEEVLDVEVRAPVREACGCGAA